MATKWAKGHSRMGVTPVYVTDEHGCLLNTEPACSVSDKAGDWFMAWLMEQAPPRMDLVAPLLYHSHAPTSAAGTLVIDTTNARMVSMPNAHAAASSMPSAAGTEGERDGHD